MFNILSKYVPKIKKYVRNLCLKKFNCTNKKKYFRHLKAYSCANFWHLGPFFGEKFYLLEKTKIFINERKKVLQIHTIYLRNI